jgi:nicotinate-nucleotide adenylyltransferase
MMRIGLFGGTFDPVHCGHLQVARDVHTGLSLAEIIFVPAALPPHKIPVRIADAEDRMAMLQMALVDFPSFSLSDVELRRSGPSYTIDTVHHFRSQYRGRAEVLLMVGLDAFLEIDTWKSYKALFQAVQMVVMSRPEDDRLHIDHYQQQIETYLQSTISRDYRYSMENNFFRHPLYQPIIPLAVTPLAISATQIRNRVATDQALRDWVPEAVAAYIKKRGLYR